MRHVAIKNLIIIILLTKELITMKSLLTNLTGHIPINQISRQAMPKPINFQPNLLQNPKFSNGVKIQQFPLTQSLLHQHNLTNPNNLKIYSYSPIAHYQMLENMSKNLGSQQKLGIDVNQTSDMTGGLKQNLSPGFTPMGINYLPLNLQKNLITPQINSEYFKKDNQMQFPKITEEQKEKIKLEDLMMLENMIFYNLILNLERHCLLNFSVSDCVIFKSHSKKVIENRKPGTTSDSNGLIQGFLESLFQKYEDLEGEGKFDEINAVIGVFENFYRESFKEHFEKLESDYQKNFEDLEFYLNN